jgi:hypothetical protein
LKCGHTSDGFNQQIALALEVPVEIVTGDHGHGQIKLGNMKSLKKEKILGVNTLVADFDKVPESITNMIESGQYSAVSVEIEDQVGEFGPVITGVALLGAEEPAVDKATLAGAQVYAFTQRQGARILSFKVGDDLVSVKAKIKSAFTKIGDVFENLVENTFSKAAPTNQEVEDNNTFKQFAVALGLPEDATADEIVAALKNLKASKPADSTQESKSKNQKGENMDILKQIAVALGLSEDATVEQVVNAVSVKGVDIKSIAVLLGLPEDATIEQIVAAINALGVAAPPPANEPPLGEMAKELKKANERIAALEASGKHQATLSAWKSKTSKFTALPGTPEEHAARLAVIEEKSGKAIADQQFSVLEAADRVAVEATKVTGTSRHSEPTDFENEVMKYRKDNPNATKADAIKAVSRTHPDLYFQKR